MLLFLDSDHQVLGQGGKNWRVWRSAGAGVPIAQHLGGAWQCITDDLVLDRPEQHLPDGDHKCNQDEK